MKTTRFFAIAVCFAVVLVSLLSPVSGAVVSADAARSVRFSDVSEMKHAQQNELLVSLGIISGMPDGSFMPNRLLSRAEAAVILYRLGSENQASEKVSLADIPESNWAYQPACFCMENGLLTCLDGNRFAPGVSITVRELCKALLILIGYPDVSEANLEELVQKNGLLAGCTLTLESFVSRDNGCLIIYNALNCCEIAEWKDGKPVYYLDELLNPVTFLEHRYHAVKYSAVVEATEQADLKVNGGFLEQGQTRLKDHNIFKVSTPLSLVGHRVDVFVRDGEILGTPHLSTSESTITFSSLVEYGTFFDENKQFSVSKDAKYYLAYNLANEKAIWTAADRLTITAIDYDCDGSFDTILVNPYYKATVVSLNALEIRFTNGKKMEVKSYDGTKELAVGDTVYALQLANSWMIEK